MENFAEIDMNKISKKYSNFWSGFCRIRIEFVFNGPLGSKSVFKLLITEPRLDEKIKRVKMHILFCFNYFLITASIRIRIKILLLRDKDRRRICVYFLVHCLRFGYFIYCERWFWIIKSIPWPKSLSMKNPAHARLSLCTAKDYPLSDFIVIESAKFLVWNILDFLRT